MVGTYSHAECSNVAQRVCPVWKHIAPADDYSVNDSDVLRGILFYGFGDKLTDSLNWQGFNLGEVFALFCHGVKALVKALGVFGSDLADGGEHSGVCVA